MAHMATNTPTTTTFWPHGHHVFHLVFRMDFRMGFWGMTRRQAEQHGNLGRLKTRSDGFPSSSSLPFDPALLLWNTWPAQQRALASADQRAHRPARGPCMRCLEEAVVDAAFSRCAAKRSFLAGSLPSLRTQLQVFARRSECLWAPLMESRSPPHDYFHTFCFFTQGQ